MAAPRRLRWRIRPVGNPVSTVVIHISVEEREFVESLKD
jgi:hypothetical protein